jgi:hypothetical protein
MPGPAAIVKNVLAAADGIFRILVAQKLKKGGYIIEPRLPRILLKIRSFRLLARFNPRSYQPITLQTIGY